MYRKLLLLICLVILMPLSVNAIATPALSALEVETNEGQGLFKDIAAGKTTFSFTLYSTLDYANIKYTPTNESYVVTGAGKVKCTEGLNKIEVVVTDPSDNSSVTYTINLTFHHYEEGTDISGKPNPNTGMFVNIPLIAAAGIGSFVVWKKSKSKKKLHNI